jgi:hypothetical protein
MDINYSIFLQRVISVPKTNCVTTGVKRVQLHTTHSCDLHSKAEVYTQITNNMESSKYGSWTSKYLLNGPDTQTEWSIACENCFGKLVTYLFYLIQVGWYEVAGKCRKLFCIYFNVTVEMKMPLFILNTITSICILMRIQEGRRHLHTKSGFCTF